MGKDLSELTSWIQAPAQQLLDNCAASGVPVNVEDVGRTQQEQIQKLAQGLSWTNHSLHLPQPPEGKSKAIDIVPVVVLSLRYWGWTGDLVTSHPAWLKIGEIGEALGFEWGGRWPYDPPHSKPDPGHFQMREPPTMPMGVEESTT